ncbi:unnamed protein product [Mucor hiemalis]
MDLDPFERSASSIINAGNVSFNDNSQQNIFNSSEARKTPTPIEKDDSFSSTDDMPTRTTNGIDENLNKEWMKEGINISKYLLKNFRIKSLEYNNSMGHKELSLARRFAPHHLFYFPLNKEKSCICYLDANVIDGIHEDIRSTIVEAVVSSNITIWAVEVEEASRCEDKFTTDLLFSKYLTTAAENKCEVQRAAAYILMEFVNNMGQSTEHQHPNAEDTFVHKVVSPFLNRLFCGEKLQSYWQVIRQERPHANRWKKG